MLRKNERLNGEGLVFSDDYGNTMNTLVLPSLAARRTDFFLEGWEGRPLFCSAFSADEPRGTVLLLHGFTGNIEKFDELIHSLLQNRYCVFAFDLRGHGRSWRAPGLSDPSVTHVDAFDEYVLDLERILEKGPAQMPRPLFLLAHSMGGAIAALYLQKHPGTFQRAVLCSPMIALRTGRVPPAFFGAACALPTALGLGKRHLGRYYHGRERFETSCSVSRERFDWYEALREKQRDLQNSCPTFGWAREALGVTGRILEMGQPERIREPVLLFSAENDTLVRADAQRRFAQRLREGQFEQVRGAKHEIYRSTDGILFPWWHRVLQFLEKE